MSCFYSEPKAAVSLRLLLPVAFVKGRIVHLGGKAKNQDYNGDGRERSTYFSDCHPEEQRMGTAGPNAQRAYSRSHSSHPDPVLVANHSKANSGTLGAGQGSHRSVALSLLPKQSAALDNCLVHLHIKTALERGLSKKKGMSVEVRKCRDKVRIARSQTELVPAKEMKQQKVP